ncbi:MAG TPA: L,D-transpeptidase family protein [Candidatus Saccharimonadales bacterium]|nr:L,D-transpeptidase family protein [Candidatus Saccharimonadales bacterium]
MNQRVWRVVLIVATSLAVLASILATTAAVSAKYYQGRILPNTVVAGITLSGKTLGEATSLINQQAIAVTTQPLTLALGDTTATASATDLGVIIDEGKTLSQLTPPTTIWGWVKPSYWTNFFKSKNQPLVYTIDETKLSAALDKNFPVSKDPVDAGLVVNNGTLQTVVAQDGITVDLDSLKQNLSTYINTTQATAISLHYTETPPSVSTDVANQVKTDISTTLQPVYLAYQDQNFTIPVADLTKVIGYTKQNSQLTWRLDPTLLQNYLKSKISQKLNVAMVQKTVLSTTGEVTQEGKDGQTVDVATLAATIIQSTTARGYTTPTTPITIPVNAIAFTTKTVYPGFQAGLYPGRYINVNLAQQQIYLIEGNNVVAQYGVSTGKWSSPTPVGVFYIGNKVPLAYSRPFHLWMPNWNGLVATPGGDDYNGVGIHGLPCFNKSCTSREGVGHIGTPVSNGCIRVDDSGVAFIYDWAPIGTPVVIQAK